VRAAISETPDPHPRAETTAVRLTATGWVARTRAARTSERDTTAVPFGPLASSVTVKGAAAVAVITIPEWAVNWAAAFVLRHACGGPAPTACGCLGVLFPAFLPDSRIATAAAATKAVRTKANRGRRRRMRT